MQAEENVTNQFDVAELSFNDFKKIVINDYKIAFESRQASILGRREVLTGKAKFGILVMGKKWLSLLWLKLLKQATGVRVIIVTKLLHLHREC